jgi:hypothetical protein
LRLAVRRILSQIIAGLHLRALEITESTR